MLNELLCTEIDMAIAVIALREEAAKHPAGSETASILAWAEIELGDRAERIFELEDDQKRANECTSKYQLALKQLHEALGITAKYAGRESHELIADDFARDFAPYKNVMAYHGVEPYVKPKRVRKAASA